MKPLGKCYNTEHPNFLLTDIKFRARARFATEKSDILTDLHAYDECMRIRSEGQSASAIRAFCEQVKTLGRSFVVIIYTDVDTHGCFARILSPPLQSATSQLFDMNFSPP